jgi:hypothetical protein
MGNTQDLVHCQVDSSQSSVLRREVLMDRWKNRRRMAWLSMLAGLVFPLLILVSESPTLGTIAMPFYIFVSAVVGSYMGFATMDDNNFKAK